MALKKEIGEVIDGSEEVQGVDTEFLVGLTNVVRTNFLELSGTCMNSLCNSSLKIKVMSLMSAAAQAAAQAAAAAAAPKGKGAPPPVEISADEALIELVVSFSSLISSNGGSSTFTTSLQNINPDDTCSNSDEYESVTILKESVVANKTCLIMRLAFDNDMAEFIAGSVVVQWGNATITNMPAEWGLKYADVIDPKAKVPATAAELRGKYLENIARMVSTSSAFANYSISLSEFPESGYDSESPKIFPAVSISKGSALFDLAQAQEFPPEENIRENSSLWSYYFPKQASSSCFLHRSIVRKLAQIAKAESTNFSPVLKGTVKKVPTSEASSADPAELSLPLLLNFSPMLQENVSSGNIACDILNEDSNTPDSEAAKMIPSGALLQISYSMTAPLVRSSEVAPSKINVYDVAGKGNRISTEEQNRDAVRELQVELSKIITLVAEEYVVMYPMAPDSASSKPGTPNKAAAAGKTTITPLSSISEAELAERRASFLYHLSTSGIYHNFKENLKPRIQRVVRAKYGVRGRAISSSIPDDSNIVPAEGFKSEEAARAATDKLLAELYVFLVKECNIVLNKMFKETIIEKEALEMEQPPAIDDEKETSIQLFKRLAHVAANAAADGRFIYAEQIHLERMQLAARQPQLAADPAQVHSAYFAHADMLLRRVGAIKLQEEKKSDNYLIERARESLELAVAAKPDEWQSMLLLSALYTEISLLEKADNMLAESLKLQLVENNKSNGMNFMSVMELDGYASDNLITVDPITYIVMSVLSMKRNEAIAARRAVRLSVCAFIEGSHQPPVSAHGKPQRTAVLCLARGALYFSQYGLFQCSTSCATMADDCDKAATAKAMQKNRSTDTAPHIRHLLKRSKALTAFVADDYEQASTCARDSVAVSDNLTDEINGTVLLGYVSKVIVTANMKGGGAGYSDDGSMPSASEVVETQISAVQKANAPPTYFNSNSGSSENSSKSAAVLVPLDMYISLSRSLLMSSRFTDALAISLYGCAAYSASATLFMVAGASSMRLDKLVEAEEALQEANLLDNRDPEIWAYLSLLCLSCGPHRLEEASKSLAQAIRMGLDNPALLRELAMAYIAVDKLQIAEDLIRRTIAVESALTESGRANPHTRKLLADILAGQNQAALAVDEYQIVIGDEYADVSTKLQAGEKCVKLLSSLGRSEEKKTLAKILDSLRKMVQADSQ